MNLEYEAGPSGSGTRAAGVVYVDVEGCLRVNGVFDAELADGIRQWLAVSQRFGRPVDLVVWSVELTAARQGAAWLGSHLSRPIRAAHKTSESVIDLDALDLVIDDDESLLDLVRVVGAIGMTPDCFIPASRAFAATASRSEPPDGGWRPSKAT